MRTSTSSRISDRGWNTSGRRSRHDNRVRRDNASSGRRARAGPAALQLGAIDLGKELDAAAAETAHLAGVEFDGQRADGGIEFGQGKEALITQGGQDPSLRDLDGDFNFALSFGRLGRAARIAVP